ncbi:hypothetical protein DEO45_04860 [Rhodanobacter denitrificans]|uniref:Haem-binding uptake Tiki superfamily ChaN domain-containing protein n=1 Tax=Rhodanobacter denitrificans TaxID=666685 RepID=A0A368KK52_9GAMM|nr:hypothetical protein [Rhodanobacter denitrificans]RCS31073.1 hypothetical protein DEO45_04860 [Rhodanobacter denitrificans]
MSNQMLLPLAFIAICLAAAAIGTVHAQDYSPAAVDMFRGLKQQPNDLARYDYLFGAIPRLPVNDQQLAMQMFASVENELGLYNEALHDFPLKSRVKPDTTLPTPAEWKAADAAEVIARLASNRRLVLVNEAHHDAHTRLLTLALLPRLRALGFDYFAVEALSGKDDRLVQRGYPVKESGTMYLHEPVYGEIVRTAIKLGFTLVAYDADAGATQDREAAQANNLYREVFARDPHAKLFVHAGYAHIDKARGRLGKAQPMAMYLQRLSGIEPLSIDQTQFREQIPPEQDAYRQLVTDFPSDGPIVLVNRGTGQPWSAQPDLYDVNVLLPPADTGGVQSGFIQPLTTVHDADRDQLQLVRRLDKLRPAWLMLHGERTSYAIGTTLCRTTFPCVVDAHYSNEPDEAIAADRYAFMQGDATSRLYLRPGNYRLRARDIRGRTLSRQAITIDKR